MTKMFGGDAPLPVAEIEVSEAEIQSFITLYTAELPEPDRAIFLEKMSHEPFRDACHRAIREMAVLIAASEIVENEFAYLRVRSSLSVGASECDQDPLLLKLKRHTLESCLDDTSMRMLEPSRFDEERLHRRLEVELSRVSSRMNGAEHAAAR